jgi:hypothetical protein
MIHWASGVLPVPPAVILPMEMTGRGACQELDRFLSKQAFLT